MPDQNHSWIIYIDGAARNNPGPAGAGIFMKKDGEVVAREGFFLGSKTNNQAEYFGLLLALFLLSRVAKSADVIRIASDSELLVKQIKGIYKIRNEGLLPLYQLAQKMMQSYSVTMMHVVRADNADADRLANLGIDAKKPLPEAFKTMLKDHGISL